MSSPHREPPPADAHNPLGIEGIEFIEYRTARPQALGQVLEMLGFRPVARHRSREVLLYRQGDMNIVVNALVVAVFAVAAWVICRRHRQRLQRLHSLEKMMDVD